MQFVFTMANMDIDGKIACFFENQRRWELEGITYRVKVKGIQKTRILENGQAILTYYY